MPTIRNAKGADIIILKEDKMLGIQVKTLSGESDIPLGNYDDPSVNYWIVFMNIRSKKINTYIIPQIDIKKGVEICEQGINSSDNLIYHDNPKQDGSKKYWINKKFLKNLKHPYTVTDPDSWNIIS